MTVDRKNASQQDQKKTYKTPELVTLGDFRELTLGGGGSKSDAGRFTRL